MFEICIKVATIQHSHLHLVSAVNLPMKPKILLHILNPPLENQVKMQHKYMYTPEVSYFIKIDEIVLENKLNL